MGSFDPGLFVCYVSVFLKENFRGNRRAGNEPVIGQFVLTLCYALAQLLERVVILRVAIRLSLWDINDHDNE